MMDDLYFMATNAGHVKIGRGVKPRERLASVQCGCPFPLRLIGTLPGKGWQEKVWHRAFVDIHIRGEWFDETAELMRAIEAALAGEEWIATLEPSLRCLRHAWDQWTPEAKEVFADPNELARSIWRNHVADIEERALTKAEAA